MFVALIAALPRSSSLIPRMSSEDHQHVMCLKAWPAVRSKRSRYVLRRSLPLALGFPAGQSNTRYRQRGRRQEAAQSLVTGECPRLRIALPTTNNAKTPIPAAIIIRMVSISSYFLSNQTLQKSSDLWHSARYSFTIRGFSDTRCSGTMLRVTQTSRVTE